jgi:TonB family protein
VLRFVASFLAACGVVAAMLMIAVELWGGFERATGEEEIPLEAHPLDLLVGYDSLDVAELLGEPRRAMPELQAPPPMPEPMTPPAPRPREVRGFVQVEVEVDARGRPVDARVLEAAPAGVYEEEALAEVLDERYPPGEPGTRIRIVDFRGRPDAVP